MFKHCLLLIAFISFTHSTFAQLPLPSAAHIVVEGKGQLQQTPDIAIVRFEIEATRGSLSEAKHVVDSEVGKALKAARAVGIVEDDIDASRIQAQPQYQWRDKNRQYMGERVSRQLQLTLRDTERYNELVEVLLKAGISRLQNTTLTFSQLEQLEQQALMLALDDAKQKATLMAKHLDTNIDGVFQIAPVSDRAVIYGMEMRAADASSSKAPLKVAKQRIEQKIRVVFLLQD